MRQWYKFYIKGQQVVAQLENEKRLQIIDEIFQIPWGHNIAIVTKIKDIEIAKFYIDKTIENSWSREILRQQIESEL